MNRELQDPTVDPRNLENDDLYALAAHRGHQRVLCDRLFLSLLPEIRRRKLWRREYASMREYANHHGVSTGVLEEVLRLEQRVAGPFPRVWELFLHGRVGWSKIKRVVAHLTPESEAYWVDILLEMSKEAIENLVRVPEGDARPGAKDAEAAEPGPTTSRFEVGLPSRRTGARLDPRREARLEFLRRHLSREYRRRISASEVLGRALDLLAAVCSEQEPREAYLRPKVRYQEILVTNEDAGETYLPGPSGAVLVTGEERAEYFGEPAGGYQGAAGKFRDLDLHPLPLRYEEERERAERSGESSTAVAPPERVERFLEFRSGGYCEAPWCRSHAQTTAHLMPRREGRDHRPSNLARLCHACHELHHAGWVMAPLQPARSWVRRPLAEGPQRTATDEMVRVARRRARHARNTRRARAHAWPPDRAA